MKISHSVDLIDVVMMPGFIVLWEPIKAFIYV